ncbi:hypothetical protein GF366_00745 [Candidatus Peregrinibacteria bacterium]|nr:hypothetical protein [Candidatus Peregrinibacteria bacterium]
MKNMFATSGDILNMSLAIGFILLIIFLCILIFYGILILRDTSKMIEEVEELVSRVHKTIVEPLRAVDYIIERAMPYIETILENKKRSRRRK